MRFELAVSVFVADELVAAAALLVADANADDEEDMMD